MNKPRQIKSPRLTLLAPAKLNLFLHITGRRADGYHELQTLFQLLDFGDELSFERSPAGVLSLHLAQDSPVAGVPLEDNLILRAARRLRDEAGDCGLGTRIELVKRIPLGAGLGGGSSDAAAALLALNALWQLELPAERLAQIGLELGADVPLFVRGQSAWGEGIGERLTPVALEPCWYLVLTPPCQVSTATVFSRENLTRNSPTIKIADFLAGRGGNDCEAVTRQLYPEVAQAQDWLQQFGKARMTGTGASVFCSFPDAAGASAALAQAPPGLHGFVARGINALQHDLQGA